MSNFKFEQQHRNNIVSLDESDYDEIYHNYPNSKKASFDGVDLPCLYEQVKSSGIILGMTKELILCLSYNPAYQLKTEEMYRLDKIAELFCGKRDYNVKWGLVETDKIERVRMDVVYQD